ncbi:FDXHR family putative zinc-binding protein [Mycobacteroides abscessus]
MARLGRRRTPGAVHAAVPVIVCNGCDSTWTGLTTCHCSGCHQTFGGISAFDQHRRASKCLSPESAGLSKSTKGHWSLPYLGVPQHV